MRRLVVAATAAVVLTGCQSAVTTSFDIVDGRVTTGVTIIFADAAATAARSDLDDVRTVIAERAGLPADHVSIVDDGTTVVAQVAVGYDRIADQAGLTGVAAATLGPPPPGHGNPGDEALTVTVATPDDLADAIAVTVADEPDAEALAAAVAGSTDIRVSVRFASGVSDAWFNADATPAGVPARVERDGDTVTLTQTLDRADSGTFVVIGDSTGARWSDRWGRWLALGILALPGVAAAARRDRRRRSS